jgi:hypothetical protein
VLAICTCSGRRAARRAEEEGKTMTIKQTIRKQLTTLVLAGAAICAANAANAYSYRFNNNANFTINHIWMHTVSNLCHDVDWYGTVPPHGSQSLNSSSICLVDRVEINGAEVWATPVGRTSTTFSWCVQPPPGRMCP